MWMMQPRRSSSRHSWTRHRCRQAVGGMRVRGRCAGKRAGAWPPWACVWCVLRAAMSLAWTGVPAQRKLNDEISLRFGHLGCCCCLKLCHRALPPRPGRLLQCGLDTPTVCRCITASSHADLCGGNTICLLLVALLHGAETHACGIGHHGID